LDVSLCETARLRLANPHTSRDTASKVPVFESYLSNISAKNSAGASPPYIGTAVVYDLPDRDCAAAASNGEYIIANNGVQNYKAYIDSLVAVIKAYSTTKVILIIGWPAPRHCL
jgi:cellulose 1,4-beta-cellobiosidase